MIDYCFNVKGFECLWSDFFIDNPASGHVMKKCDFRELVSERNEEEIILCKNDKHLDFQVGIYCSKQEEGWQETSVTTVVKFNNCLGRLYFIGIWMFHKLLVGSLFRKAVRG